MKKKTTHIVLVIFAGLFISALFVTKLNLPLERVKKIGFFQTNMEDQAENQVRTFSPVWHSITRRFLP
jgi:hypothetical protein